MVQYHLPEEQRQKISASLKGHKHTEESIEKMRASKKGHIVTEKTRQKISISNSGRQRSNETRKKMSDYQKRKYEDVNERKKQSERLKGKPHKPLVGELNPFYGKHHTEESKEKNRIAHTGKVCSYETKKKMSLQRQKDKHWNWKGGVSFEPYCPKFDEPFKEGVRIIYNYACQICGHIWQPGEHKLAVHHVNYDKMVCCDNVEPMFVVLCHGKCHSITNYNRKYWEEVFTNLILLEYDGKSYFTRDELKDRGLI